MSAASSTVSTSASPTAPTTTRDSDEARAVRAARRRATARFALTRLIQSIFVVWVAVTITFIGLHLAQRLRRAR